MMVKDFFETDPNLTFLDPLWHTFYMDHDADSFKKHVNFEKLIKMVKHFLDTTFSCDPQKFHDQNGDDIFQTMFPENLRFRLF